MDFLYLIFYDCLRLRFLDVETNPGPRRSVPVICRILVEILVNGFGRPVLLCRGKMTRARGMAAYTLNGYRAFR